jgi:uncharacterized membrane protein
MTRLTTDSRHTAQQRADDIQAFRREWLMLQREGVIAPDDVTQDAIQRHHTGLLANYAQAFAIDRNARDKQLSLGMRVTSFAGALALAASVFFLFYQFWGTLGTVAQVVILIGASLLSFIAVLLVQRVDDSGYFSKLAAMVAFACFVLNISMLGQIFNITPSDKALLPWAAYALLLAYFCDLRLLLGAGLLCIIGFVSARIGTWCGIYWLSAGERPENFLPVGIALFLLPLMVSHRRYTNFDSIYRVFGLCSILIPVLILGHWGYGSYLASHTDIDADAIEVLYQLSAFVLCSAAIWLGINRQWSDTLNTGTVFLFIFLFTKFFDWWWEIMPKYQFFLLLALITLLMLFVMRRLRTTINNSGVHNV